MGEQVGTVAALWRYPVKSMAGEALPVAEASWNGLAGDRRWAFVRAGQEDNTFPWMTIRERSEMALFRPRLLEPERPDASTVAVATPEGGELAITDPALAERLGGGVRLMRLGRGAFDAVPLSLISLQSVAEIGALAGTSELDPRRFRPNVVVDAAGGEPFAEERWIGRVLRIGGLRLRLDRRDSRCVIVNVDPGSARRDARVLRAVAREREACAGVYGATVEPGRLAVGDPVVLEA